MDITEGIAVLSVMGPNSRELLSRLTDVDLSLEGFPLYTFRKIQLAGVTMRVGRLSYVGELGWEL